MASGKKTDVSGVGDDDDLDEEPGEVIESAPPMKVGEERPLKHAGLVKKLLKRGRGWETPELGDEAAVHFVATLIDGTRFDSTRDRDEPLTLKLGQGQLVSGLDHGILTMKEEECALFTVPPELGYGAVGREGVPPNAAVRFQVELISWIRVVDICKDGGIVKNILVKGERNEPPSDLDEVLVKYRVALLDGTTIAEAPEGLEFYVKDGHLCPAFSKAVMTMKKGERVKLLIQPQYAFAEKEFDNCDQLHNVPPNSTLNVDLELVSFKPVIDVTGDNKVLKKILKEGEGAFTANEGAAVTISYAARLEDGTVFEKKGLDGEQPLNFVTDEEQVIAGLDRASATMKKGELAMVTINHEYGLGSVEVERNLAIVPPFSNLIYEVEMLDFVKERAPWEMNNCERIEEAGRKKEEGNLLFKAGKFRRAGKKYDKAADYVSEDGSFGDDEQKLVKALTVACWLNSAACSLKLNDFQEAIRLCSKVLDFEFYNVKAWYRRAQAYMEIADLVSAELDIRKALDIDPVNRSGEMSIKHMDDIPALNFAFHCELLTLMLECTSVREVKILERSLRRLQAESDRRDAKVYSNMFARMTKDTSMAIKKLKVEKPGKSKDEEESLVAMHMEETADSSVPAETRTVVDSTLNTFS